MSAPPFPIHAYVEAARANPETFARARALFAARAATLWERGDAVKRAISSSDAGRCGAQVQAEIRGAYDLPDSAFSARDAGTLGGAWIAALFVAAMELRHPDLVCALETDETWGGVGGHTDISVRPWRDDIQAATYPAVWTIEIKTTASFSVRPPHENGKTVAANLHHVVQAAHRALADGAPIATVYTKGAGEAYDQADYDVASWVEAVREEYARLARGEKDATRDYQCKGCQWSACERNQNPLKPVAPLIELLEASIA